MMRFLAAHVQIWLLQKNPVI